MRRFLFWIMLISGVLMIIIGITEAHVHPTTLPVAHIFVSSIFVLATVIHLIINRKAVLKYLLNK
jgi:hypothetical protein